MNDLEERFAAGWRVVDGSAAPVLQPVLNTNDGPVAKVRARIDAQLGHRPPDRLVLTLEHD